MQIDVIKPGILIRNKNNFIVKAESSVTLIQTENKTIIVDTSVKKAKNEIFDGLKKYNLTPAEIDIVFCTHHHLDHISNNHLFENSKMYINKIEIQSRKHSNLIPLTIIPNKPFQLTKNVLLIDTPGHTLGSTSVIFQLGEIAYVITGDAIPIQNNFLNWVPPFVNVDPNQCLKSMEKIKNIADIIIPGHDEMFKIKS
ncbi:MAG: MBL fold metallo-hydrolase [Candidatus Lokiarchaeota archaeon]|nr:MBL fold metallo-hydrolase [Candidatus Lokiarchaeota archaeon]